MAEKIQQDVYKRQVKYARGIEVGQVFKLGTKYSESMNATYKDEKQEDKYVVMGCYGIGAVSYTHLIPIYQIKACLWKALYFCFLLSRIANRILAGSKQLWFRLP